MTRDEVFHMLYYYGSYADALLQKRTIPPKIQRSSRDRADPTAIVS